MTTQANYIIKAAVGGDIYVFQYEEAMDAWEAMEQFWHEDYPEVLMDMPGGELFPIDVYAMSENGSKVIATYPFVFNAAVFHAYYDNGHKADGPYATNEFMDDILRKDNQERTPRDIIALWSDWCIGWDDENRWLDYMVKHPQGHCTRQHLQEKWDHCYEKYGNKAAMTMFWRELDGINCDILTEYITTQWRKQ